MTQYICINGQYKSRESAVINVYDHGLLYGDGIYEGLRCYDGVIFQMDEHLNRLWRSAKSLRMTLPWDKETIVEWITKTIQKNDLLNAYIRIVITRGEGEIGPDPDSCKQPNCIIIVEEIQNVHGKKARSSGVSLSIVSTKRDPVDGTSHEIKSLNYLNSVMAKMEAKQSEADDALMLDSRGMISESSICNIFIVDDKDQLITPGSANGILAGITRKMVFDIAKDHHISVIERDITPFELINAQEAFLTGTHAEIVYIQKVNNITIGTQKRVTPMIINEFQNRIGDKEYGYEIK